MNLPSRLRRLRASLYSCPGSPSLLILGGKGHHIGGQFGAYAQSSSSWSWSTGDSATVFGSVVGALGDPPSVG